MNSPEKTTTKTSPVDDFVSQNAKWLIGLIFFAGVLYGEFKEMQAYKDVLVNHIETVETRLKKKIDVINDHDEMIEDLKQRDHELEIRLIKLEEK